MLLLPQNTTALAELPCYRIQGTMAMATECPRWQEYTELYKKDLHDPDNHDDVITHLEPDILECEVKWALESINLTKLVEVMAFQLSYFKSSKMMLSKGHLTSHSRMSGST